MTTQTDVLCIGNAIVDILTHVEEDFLIQEDITKGSMTLVDKENAQALYNKLGQAVECSGGSAANTAAGLAALGSQTAYIGKIRNDQLGNVFHHDISALGVNFQVNPATDGPATATCLVMVTPDAQRTMCTFLGACVNLTVDDVTEEAVGGAAITYLEGYLWDPEPAKQAFKKAIKIAHDKGRRTSLTLSDSFCVSRYKEEFLDLARDDIDILFANEDEILMLYGTDDFDDAARQVQQHCAVTAITRSEKGCVVVSADDIIHVPTSPAVNLVDTTGAGDLFAAGFLHGLSQDEPLDICARMGNIMAGEVICHLGARPDVDLKAILRQNM